VAHQGIREYFGRLWTTVADHSGRNLPTSRPSGGLGTLNSVLAALEADHVDASWAVQSTVFVSVGYTGEE